MTSNALSWFRHQVLKSADSTKGYLTLELGLSMNDRFWWRTHLSQQARPLHVERPNLIPSPISSCPVHLSSETWVTADISVCVLCHTMFTKAFFSKIHWKPSKWGLAWIRIVLFHFLLFFIFFLPSVRMQFLKVNVFNWPRNEGRPEYGLCTQGQHLATLSHFEEIKNTSLVIWGSFTNWYWVACTSTQEDHRLKF